ncbi:MAG: metal-dependent hydrolase [Haloarculaceae archaeon]
MTDLLAHVLVAYSLCRVLSWRYDWLTSEYVTLGMVGAFIPDILKIQLLVPDETVARLLGVPFNWDSLQTGGGVIVSVLVGVALLATGQRRRGGLLLGLGASSHLVLDEMLLTPSHRSGLQILWPLAQYRLPSPGLYLSTQPGPTLVAGGIAVLVYVLDRQRPWSADA